MSATTAFDAEAETTAALATTTNGKARLMDRLRQRHIDALTAFQTKCREASASIDNEVIEQLRQLRNTLAMGRAEAERRLETAENANRDHKAILERSASSFADRDVGGAVVLIEDEMHPAGETFFTTLDRRAMRLEAERRAVLELGLWQKEAFQSRMAAIAETESFISAAEGRRRHTMHALLEKLLETLSSIAYVNTTVSQLLVHRAAVSVNQQLLSNDVSTKELLTKLRQLDVHKLKAYQQRVATLYTQRLETLAESVALWSRQIICTAHFREPQCRAQVLHHAEATLRQTKKDVANLIAGVGLLVDTLSRNPHGIGSTVTSEVPGGAVPSGWLQYFNHDAKAIAAPFTAGPEAVADQWQVSVTVILQQLRLDHSRAVEDATSGERVLQAEANQIANIMTADIEGLFTPSAAEVDVVRRASLDPTSDDAAPFAAVVVPNPTRAVVLQGAALEHLEPHMASLVTEGQWFTDALVMHQYIRGNGLVNTLLGPTGGLVPIILGATQALYAIATEIAVIMREQYTAHENVYKDFMDAAFRLEQAYQLTEDHLVHAGTVQAAQQLCIAGMELLKAIEAQYCKHHSQRTAMLPAFASQLRAAIQNATQRILDDVCVVPLATIKSKNDALEAEVNAARERVKLVAAGKDKSIKPADAQAMLATVQERAAKESVVIEGLPVVRVKGAGGTVIEYIALNPAQVRYGGADKSFSAPQQAKGKEAPVPTSAKELKAARAAAASGKAAAGAAGKAALGASTASAASGVAESSSAGDGPGALETLPELPQWTDHARYFIQALRNRMAPIFHEECFVDKTAVHGVIIHLRSAVLSWVNEFAHRATLKSIEFSEGVKNKVDEDTNEAIRRHYRRPPTLQSQVLEARLRELQDAMQTRTKYFAWIRQRVAACGTNARTAIESTAGPVARDLAALQTLTTNLTTLHAIPAVEASSRSAQALVRTAQEHADKQLEAARTQLVQAIDVVRRECRSYAEERMKSFDEGGDMSREEKIRGLEEIRQILAFADGTEHDNSAAVQAARESHSTRVAAAWKAYQAAFEHSRAELKFLCRLQELLSSAKGKLSGQITQSTALLQNLEAAVAKAEALIGSSTTLVRKDLRASAILKALEWERTGLDVSQSVASILPGTESVPVDPPLWTTADHCVSERLRTTKVLFETSLSNCRAAKLLDAMEDLRKQLYNRGAYVGCLAYGCELSPVPADTYFEPKVAAQGTGGPDGAQAAGAAQAKPAAGGKAGKAPAPSAKTATGTSGGPGDGSSNAPLDDVDAWGAFMKVLRWDQQFSKTLQPIRESIATALEYFNARPGPLVRKEAFGADAAAVKASVEAKLAQFEARLGEHNASQVVSYRVLVQRVHLLSHRVASEVLTSLANTTSDSLDARCEDILTVFAAFYWSLGSERVKAAGQLKGSMNAPSSRSRLDLVNTTELQRQQRAAQITRLLGGALVRETQDEAHRFASRASQALTCLFTMLRSLVTPEHLVPGEEVVVGEHKGIKRLMRQKMKEDAAKALEAAAAGSGGKAGAASKPGDGGKGPGAKPAAADAKKGAKDDPKSKAGAKGASAKAAQDEDDAMALPLLERPIVEYAGIRVNGVRPLDAWKRANPEFLLRDHYEPPAAWAAAEAAERAAAEASAAAALAAASGKGGKGAAAPAAGKAQAPAAGGKAGAPAGPGGKATDASAATFSDVEAVVSPPIAGPQDRLFQAAWLTRQQLVELMGELLLNFASQSDTKAKELLGAEHTWAASWKAAIAALVAGVEH